MLQPKPFVKLKGVFLMYRITIAFVLVLGIALIGSWAQGQSVSASGPTYTFSGDFSVKPAAGVTFPVSINGTFPVDATIVGTPSFSCTNCGGGVAGQTQVRNSSDTAWVNVGPTSPNVHMPVDVLNTPAVTINGTVSTNATIVGTPGVTATIVGTPSVTVANGVTLAGLANIIACDQSTPISQSTGTVQLVAPVASKSVYICSYEVVAGAADTVNFSSADASCANPVALEGAKAYAANGGAARGNGLGMVLKTPAGKGLCLTVTASTGGSFAWTQQ